MSRYQHKRGKIQDNALEALLHDPLFRQRVEKNSKGKGSYKRKAKHGGKGWQGVQFALTLRFLDMALGPFINQPHHESPWEL